jgi:hypothetical protein
MTPTTRDLALANLLSQWVAWYEHEGENAALMTGAGRPSMLLGESRRTLTAIEADAALAAEPEPRRLLVASWQCPECGELHGDDALEAALRDVAEARRLAEYERSRVKLSMVYPNWHEPFPWGSAALDAHNKEGT